MCVCVCVCVCMCVCVCVMLVCCLFLKNTFLVWVLLMDGWMDERMEMGSCIYLYLYIIEIYSR